MLFVVSEIKNSKFYVVYCFQNKTQNDMLFVVSEIKLIKTQNDMLFVVSEIKLKMITHLKYRHRCCYSALGAYDYEHHR